jgi:hypothetical protein
VAPTKSGLALRTCVSDVIRNLHCLQLLYYMYIRTVMAAPRAVRQDPTWEPAERNTRGLLKALSKAVEGAANPCRQCPGTLVISQNKPALVVGGMRVRDEA